MPYVSNEVFGEANSFIYNEFSMADFDADVLGDSIERQIDLFLGLIQGTTQVGIPEGGACWRVVGKFIGAISSEVEDDITTLQSYAGVTSTMVFPTGELPPDDLIAYAGCIYETSELVAGSVKMRTDGLYQAEYKLVIRVG